MAKPFLSICIPSYNRPDELYRLLLSIDLEAAEEIEIVICEDASPKRDQIREKVYEYQKQSKYKVNYVENEKNFGYDKNLRQCISQAEGKWIVFMGDDDLFVPGAMDGYLSFLKEHNDCGYVLRSYCTVHKDGGIEYFKYFPDTCFFHAGEESYVILFRKSVFISGFTFRRELALKNMTDRFDGTLLYQLYILAEICMRYSSAYYGETITQSVEGGIPYFGNSDAEKNLYTPGKATPENSINFMKSYFLITRHMDKKYGIHSTEAVQKDLSKYAYPILSIQRERGRRVFREYHKQLKGIGLACTGYYYIYYFGLWLLGEQICDSVIRTIKKVLGRTPKL